MNLRNWSWDHTKGLILGFITPLCVVPLVVYITALSQNYLFEQLWRKFTFNDSFQIKMITLSIIANLAWFYLFLNKERFNFAMGVILGSMIYAPYIIYIKFLLL